MRAIVVGDLHGKYEIVEAVLKDKESQIIFIGDYLDSFDRKVVEQLRVLDLVLEGVKDNPDRVFALRGNHELSYQEKKMQCSGYNRGTQLHVNERDLSPLIDYIWVDEYLISHAGVSQKLLDHTEQTIDEYLDAREYSQIGWARGGYDRVGGLYWCDFWQEFEPVEGVPQIVGHSAHRPHGQGEGIVPKGNAWNIDCLDRVDEVLVLEAGKDPRPCVVNELLEKSE